jgi:thiol-disulfide isomerase/thioredoxin
MTLGARLAAGILAVALGIWAGARLYAWQQRSPDTQRTTVGDAGVGAPEDLADVLGAPLRQIKIPDRLPQFALVDPEGHRTPISSFAGQALVINFWATWCAPCRSEMPLLQALSKEWTGRATVVGIAVDHRESVVEYARKLGIAYPILIGDQDALDAAAALGMTSPVFPFTVFTDRRGEVVTLFVGELHKNQAELILSEVAALDRDQVLLAEARKAITAGLKTLPGDRG